MGESLAGAEQPFLVRSDPEPGVVRLTMARPERRNALSSAAMQELLSSFEGLAKDEAARCVLLEADGPVFSAGHDLKELRGLQSSESSGCRSVFELCARLMIEIVSSRLPSIAVVEGLATAAGCQLVASCDLAVASERASFATPGVDIGLFCSTPSVALSRNVGRKAAMEMLLLGERIDAQRARELGLVNRVEPVGEAGGVALRMASAIASKPMRTVASGKAGFYRQVESGLADAYRSMSEQMAVGLLGDDASEGIGAFVDKRKPTWNR